MICLVLNTPDGPAVSAIIPQRGETEAQAATREIAALPVGTSGFALDPSLLPPGNPETWTVDVAARKVTTNTAAASAVLAANVRAECERRISAALGSPNKQASMHREATELLRLFATGAQMTTVQKADAALLTQINAWETAMIEKREALIANGDATYADNRHWPSLPAGLTPEWLAGY